MIQVLFVDDEEGIRELTRIFLERTGEMHLDTGSSAAEALEQLVRKSYDIVVSDYHMPDMDGITFLREIRSRYPRMPIIIFTGKGREEVVIEAFLHGADFYVQKGGAQDVQFADLAQKIRVAVGKRRAEEALQESEGRYRHLFETMAQGVLILSRDGRLLEANPAAKRILGLSPGREGDYPGPGWKTVREDQTPIPLGEQPFQVAKRTGQEVSDLVMGVTNPLDGTLHWIKAHATPRFRSGEKDPYQVYMTFEEFTGRKIAEDALRIANTKLTILQTLTRHDILNQLIVLSGYLSMVRDESRERAVDPYLSEAEVVAKTIRHQIEFTRECQNLGMNPPEWQNLEDVIRESLDQIAPFPFTVDQEITGLCLLADPLLVKVFMTLFQNIRKHSRNADRITISAAREGDSTVVIIADNGVGIPRSQKERIFTPEYGQNSSFGLYLVRTILDMSGISIAENGSEGAGARFELRVRPGGFRFAPKTGT
jgi:signal transduction histidine kinase